MEVADWETGGGGGERVLLVGDIEDDLERTEARARSEEVVCSGAAAIEFIYMIHSSASCF